jgi:hypothetical protein
MKDLSKQQIFIEPKMAQLDKVLSNWFTATFQKRKPVIGHKKKKKLEP